MILSPIRSKRSTGSDLRIATARSHDASRSGTPLHFKKYSNYAPTPHFFASYRKTVLHPEGLAPSYV